MKCEICGKEVKNIKAHIRLAHPAPIISPQQQQQIEEAAELRGQIDQLKAHIENNKAVGKGVEDIAKILYSDIVKPLGEEYGFTVQEWGSFDPAGYIQVARKIKG